MLKMTNINKSFFGVNVLCDVSVHVKKGTVHALLGENGAGKSTLMNIFGGVHERDSGTITLDGECIEKVTTKLASDLGVAFVHQELNFFNDLLVYENIFLRRELVGKLGNLKKKEMIAQTKELFASLAINIDPCAAVSQLTTSNKQLLEIAKALHKDAKIFILDEPTTALGNKEIESLFSIINKLKAQGKSFIFISHKMPEIFAVADEYTVLRNGYYVASGKIADTNPEKITRLMVGESYDNSEVYESRVLAEPVLQLENFSGVGFNNVNLAVHKGEILSLTGLQGAGCGRAFASAFLA